MDGVDDPFEQSQLREGMRMPPPMTMQSQWPASEAAIVASALMSVRIEQKAASQPRAFISDRVASIPAAIFSGVVPDGKSGSEKSTASGLIPIRRTRVMLLAPLYRRDQLTGSRLVR